MNFGDYLFHTPWWLPTIVAAVGAVIFYVANSRGESRLRTIGSAVIALGVAIALISYFVDTDLEKAEKRTRQLVQAVNDKDWNRVGSLLHPRTSVGIANAITLYNGRDEIVARARDACERYGVKSVTVTSLQSRQDQTLITITVSVLSYQDATLGSPLTSTWEFNYEQSANGWYLGDIRAIEIGRQTGESMEHMFPRGIRR